MGTGSGPLPGPSSLNHLLSFLLSVRQKNKSREEKCGCDNERLLQKPKFSLETRWLAPCLTFISAALLSLRLLHPCCYVYFCHPDGAWPGLLAGGKATPSGGLEKDSSARVCVCVCAGLKFLSLIPPNSQREITNTHRFTHTEICCLEPVYQFS